MLKHKFDTSDLADWADGTKMPMKITANIATYPPRLESLKQMVASIYEQVDEIRIVFNQYDCKDIPNFFYELDKVQVMVWDVDMMDNGKFISLSMIQEPEY